MKNCWKQVVMFVLVAVAALWIGKTDAKAATIVETGSCGKNVTYTLDSDGVLTISGSGAIKGYAFQNYSSLTSVTILDGVTSIGRYAFSMCTSLTSITIPDSVTSIGTHAFTQSSSLTSITIPDSVTSIDCGMFSECSDLMSVTIPDSVTRIGEEAFRDCSSLKNITIPDSVTSIGNLAFGGCTNLTSVTIPYSVNSIGEQVFYRCRCLTNIKIAASNEKCLIINNCDKVERDIVAATEVLRTGKMDPEVKMPLNMKIQLSAILIDLHDNAEAKAYVKKVLTKGMKAMIDSGNLELIQVLLEKTDFVTKKNVDKYVQYAIDAKQQEIYLTLIHYKDEIGAYTEISKKFRL